MKKFLLLFLFAMAIPMTMMAATITKEINKIRYSLDTTNKTATVIKPENGYSTIYNGTSVVIPATVIYNNEVYNVTAIGEEAFRQKSRLEYVEIPEGVTSIGHGAFSGCKGLLSMTLPNSVTSLGSEAFYDCEGLTSINIPDGVTTIEYSTFLGCKSLTSVEIPNGVTTIGNTAFQGCSRLESVTIPNCVTTIGSSAFYGCKSLTSVTIPDGVTSIENSTFYSCASLTSITIPNNVTSIGNSAFYNCNGLVSLEIGSGVQNIGDKAFSNIVKLQTVTCNATSVPTTNSTAFDGSYIELVTLIVPPEAYDDYYSVEPWMNFGTQLTTKVTANSYTREYGDANPVFEYIVDGTPLNGTPEISCTADATSAPGTYPITISQGTVTNPRIVFVDGTLTITMAPLTITANGYTINEGESMPVFEAEYTGLKNGETEDVVNPVFNCTATDSNTPGYYPINVTATSNNYDITCISGALTIIPTSGNTTIKIGEAGMATFCSPYDLNFSEVTGLKAYIITGYDKFSKRVYAMRAYDVPSGTGLYLVGNPGSYNVPLTTSNSYYINMLVGTLVQTWIEPTDGDLTNLRLTGTSPSNASFKILSEGRNFSANKAYLQIPTYILGNTANAATSFGIVLDDDTNGIEDIMLNSDDSDSEWYTIDGRKLNGKPSARGIYVVKGRKVVIK